MEGGGPAVEGGLAVEGGPAVEGMVDECEGLVVEESLREPLE